MNTDKNTLWSAFDAQGHALDCDGWRASHDGNGSTAHMPIKDASGEVVALVVMKSENHDWLDPKPIARQIVDAVNAQAADPLDTPLPCDIKIGHGTHKKGTSLRTLVKRMQVLYDMAQERANATTPEPASIWTRTEDGKLILPPGIKAIAQDAEGGA